MVIACGNGVDDISSPSLLFDSDTPISIPHDVTELPSSDLQANSMATEQDSVNTIPDTVEDDGRVSCSDVSIGTTAECNGEDVTLNDTDNISVANSSDGTGETPVDSCSSDIWSSTHLLDHSYAALHNGIADSSCEEELKCQEKMEKYSAMVTPLTGKVNVLLKDNGCHAARCSAIKRSNRRLARVRRQQVASLLSKKQLKRGMKDKQMFTVEGVLPQVIRLSQAEESCGQEQTTLHVTPSMPTESDSVMATSDNAVATVVDSVAKSSDFVTLTTTSSEQTVLQTTVAVTQSVDKVSQATVTMAQSIDPVPQTTVTVTKSIDTVTQATVAATQPADTVTQTTVAATQSVDTVTQVTVAATQSVTQSRDMGTQTKASMQKENNRHLLETASKTSTCTHSTITCSPPGVKAPCSVSNSNFGVKPMQLEQNMPHVSKDTITHQKDIVTQSTDTVTHVQRPPHTIPHHTASNNSSFVANTQTLVRYNQHQRHSVATAVPLQTPWPSDQYLQQYNNLLRQLALGTMPTASNNVYGNQAGRRSSLLVAGDTSSKMACLYGMLSSCLATSDYAIPSSPVTMSTPAIPHVTLSGQTLPMIQNVFSDVNSEFSQHSNRQLPGIIRQRQPIVYTGTPSYRNQFHPLTSVVPSTSASNTCSRFRPIQAMKSPLVTVLTSVNPSPVMSDKSVDTVTITTASCNHLQPIISSHAVSTNSPSSTSLAVNSPSVSLKSINSPSVTNLTSTNSSSVSLTSSSVTTLISVNSPIVSLTSVNSSSVTNLTSTNSSSGSLTSVNPPSVTSLTSTNSLIVSLTSINSPSVTSLTSVNSSSVTSLTSTNSSSVSLTSNYCQTVTTVTPVNSLSVNSLTLVTSPSVSLTSVNSPSVTINSSSDSLTSINSPSIKSLTSANSPSIIASDNSSSPTLTSVNSQSVTSLMSVNSPSVPVTSVTSTGVTNLPSVNSSSVTTLMSVNSASVPVTSVASTGVTSLTSVNSPSVTTSPSSKPVIPSSDANHIISSASNECPLDTLKQAKSPESVNVKVLASNSDVISVAIEAVSQAVPEGSKSSDSVTIETICQPVPEGDKSNNSDKQSSTTESPPHTPTGGILKRVSQFDTPTISGKVRFHSSVVQYVIVNTTQYRGDEYHLQTRLKITRITVMFTATGDTSRRHVLNFIVRLF